MQRWGVRPCWDVTVGVFGGYFIGNVDRIWQWSQGYGYRSNTFITMMIRGGFRHNEFIPVLRMKYNPRGFGYVSPGITYMPGKHLRVTAGYVYFYARNPAVHREAAVEDRDFAYLRIRWEY
jgi:long-subunit fatty acid transport protein